MAAYTENLEVGQPVKNQSGESEEVKEMTMKGDQTIEQAGPSHSTVLDLNFLKRDNAELKELIIQQEKDHTNALWELRVEHLVELNALNIANSILQTEFNCANEKLQDCNNRYRQYESLLQDKEEVLNKFKQAASSAENERDMLKREVRVLQEDMKQAAKNAEDELAMLERDVDDLQNGIARELRAKDLEISVQEEVVASLYSKLGGMSMDSPDPKDDNESSIVRVMWRLCLVAVYNVVCAMIGIVVIIAIIVLVADLTQNT